MWLSDYKDEREINCDNLLINDIITIHISNVCQWRAEEIIVLKQFQKINEFKLINWRAFEVP